MAIVRVRTVSGGLPATLSKPDAGNCAGRAVYGVEAGLTVDVNRAIILKCMRRILVIDDEEPIRAMMGMALRQKGFMVVEAENGEEGVQLARKELPDVIICDVKMKKMDGYATLMALRNDPATAAIPFILMTGYADSEGMRYGMELGADDYLPKPFTIEGLYAAVDARLKKAEMMREQAEKKLADLRQNISFMLPHELRTPLNGILAYAELLQTDAATLSPGDLMEMGQVIQQSGRRLQRLIENFLIYAQIELMAADPASTQALRARETLQPALVIEKCAQNQADAAGRSADLRLDLSDCPVRMSDVFIEKIADELISNAFKFSRPGTPVRVVFGRMSDTASLVVVDHGRGMDKEQITRIGAYMQFQRKVQEQQGVGLGLIISKRLAELHGGGLLIQSEPGQGTTVTVTLPCGGVKAG